MSLKKLVHLNKGILCTMQNNNMADT